MFASNSSRWLIFCFTLILRSDIIVLGSRLPLIADDTGPNNEDGMVVFGDMAMTEELYKYLISPPSTTRKIIGPPDFKWPEEQGHPTVPYDFKVTRYENEIRAGMQHWEENTCIRFREKTERDASYVEFFNGNGCWSYVGKISSTAKQQISIGDGCKSLGTVTHEIGHAIGFIHEQMRPDRDEFVKVNLENVDFDNQNNFQKFSAWDYVNYNVKYDYTSVMQYDGTAFSNNGRLTLATTDPKHQGLLGRGRTLSHRDKIVANTHYGCLEKWMDNCGRSENPCLNAGYLGKNCKCVCPTGTTGDLCQSAPSNYYDPLLPSCNLKITREMEFTSPYYPSGIPYDTWCVYKIQAPIGYVVQVRFLDFSLESYRSTGPKRCASSFLEIRDQDDYEGTIFCGDDIQNERKFTSQSRDMILYLDVPYGRASRGFKATVTFVNIKEPVTKVEIIVSSLPQGISKMTETSEASMKTSTTSSPGIRGNGDAASTCCLCPLLVFILLALNKMYSDHFYYGVMQD